MKCIALIENGYARDTQIFNGTPDGMNNDCDWENNFLDVKYPIHYLGIFEGVTEEEIRDNAADPLGVHPDIITLIPVDDEKDFASKPQNEGYICLVCQNEEHPADAKFCKICGNPIQSQQIKELTDDADIFEFERLCNHVGHEIEVALYGGDKNVSIECMDCCEVLYSLDNPKSESEGVSND